MSKQQVAGYDVNAGGFLEAPSACDECLAGQRGELNRRDWGQGHYLCQQVPDDLLEAHAGGDIHNVLIDNRWRFRVV